MSNEPGHPNDQRAFTPATAPEPVYGCSFPLAIKRFFSKYAVFRGRASRSEYWFVALYNVLIAIAVGIVVIIIESISPTQGNTSASAWIGVPYAFYWLAIIIPSISIFVRRLHDIDLSGWFYWLTVIPLFGGVIALIFTLVPPNPRGARFDR
jgi:uncharacterized membrane protein YhaH (DUF805 family)